MALLEGLPPRRQIVSATQQQYLAHHTRRFRERVFAIPFCEEEARPPGPLALFSFLTGRVISSSTPSLSTGSFLLAKEDNVNFPIIHYKEDDGTLEKYLLAGHVFENNIMLQGVYREVRSICPEEDLLPPEAPHHLAYIMLAYKNNDYNFSQVMVDSWKDWTGARYIYMYLPDDLGLARIRLYRREAPNTHGMFTYVVLVECRTVDTSDKQTCLLDFARRLRVQKMNGYVTVYGLSNKENLLYY